MKLADLQLNKYMLWKHLIPLSQAAYEAGRSTTEQVYAVKIPEKVITSSDYEVHILMLDMSKAFDIVDTGKLFKMLHNTLLPEELHLLNLLVNDFSIRVWVGKETGEEINTLLGIMQGDCLGAILFIVYLAQVMTPKMPIHQAEHSYAKTSNSIQFQFHAENLLIKKITLMHPSLIHLINANLSWLIQNMLMISHGSLSQLLQYYPIYQS